MWYVIVFALVILLDQGTKIWAAAFSGAVGNAGVSSVHLAWVIPDFIEISYCENSNGSMGLFAGIPHIQTIFKISTVVIIAAIVVYMILSKKKRSKWLNVTLALILSGAIGNFIDRMTLTYVRDMIHVIIDFGKGEIFPYIFNVADMALVVGAIMLIVHLLFLDKDALFRSRKKDGEESKEKSSSADGK